MTKVSDNNGKGPGSGRVATPDWLPDAKKDADQSVRTGKRPWFHLADGNAIYGIYKRREEFMWNNRPRVAYVLQLLQPALCAVAKDTLDHVKVGEHVNVGMTAALRCIEDLPEGIPLLIIIGKKMPQSDGTSLWDVEVQTNRNAVSIHGEVQP